LPISDFAGKNWLVVAREILQLARVSQVQVRIFHTRFYSGSCKLEIHFWTANNSLRSVQLGNMARLDVKFIAIKVCNLCTFLAHIAFFYCGYSQK
jgi:hypothetical protein